MKRFRHVDWPLISITTLIMGAGFSLLLILMTASLSITVCWWSQDIDSFSCQFLGSKKGT